MVTADQVSITQPDTDNYSHQCRITYYPNQMQVFGLEPGTWKERMQTWRGHVNSTEMLQPRFEPSCCEATLLTTAPQGQSYW